MRVTLEEGVQAATRDDSGRVHRAMRPDLVGYGPPGSRFRSELAHSPASRLLAVCYALPSYIGLRELKASSRTFEA